jgi:hypothetical protein
MKYIWQKAFLRHAPGTAKNTREDSSDECKSEKPTQLPVFYNTGNTRNLYGISG